MEEELSTLHKEDVPSLIFDCKHDDDSKVALYIWVFMMYRLKVSFDFLGPAATLLHYTDSTRARHERKKRP